MALAFDSVSQGLNNSGNSVSFSHTCSGTNRIVFAYLRSSSTGGGGVISIPTYNGVNMTLGANNSANQGNSAMYYLINPPTGAQTFAAGASAGGSSSFSAFIVSYTGANQTAQPDSTNTGTEGGSSPFNASTTVVANGSWVVGGFAEAIGAGVGGASTQRGTTINGNTVYADTNGLVSPGTQNIQFTSSVSGNGFWILMSITPDVSPTTTNGSFLLKLI